MKVTIKKFEQMLFEKHGQLEKADHFENNYSGDEPTVVKLWLYYVNGKHVGTYNRKARVANFIDC
jgi:hypothetical protein